MIRPVLPKTLSLEAMQRIERACTRFEEFANPTDRDFAILLGDSSGLERTTLLCELVKLDIELRGEQGDDACETDYLDAVALVDTSLLEQDFWAHVSADIPVAPASTSSDYDFLSPIGTGGIGVVWRVHDKTNQRTLAVKLLRDTFCSDVEAISRFHFEGLLTGSLQHPGIPPVYDRGQLNNGTPYFAMKWVDGQTLRSMLDDRANDQADTNQLLSVFQQVAQTLAYAHNQAVIHRDVKPQNIMVGHFGEVQVMDWGLAKRLGSESEGDEVTPSISDPKNLQPNSDDTNLDFVGMTTAGDVVGTPGHMSPEQARGELDSLSPRADVFGLGTILFEILTGTHPFNGLSRSEVIAKTKSGDLSRSLSILECSTADAELISLCQDCLSPLPDSRPEDAGAVADATREYLSGIEARLRTAELRNREVEVRRSEERKRMRWIIGLSSLIALVAIAGTLAVSKQWQQARESAQAAHKSRLTAENESQAATEINAILNEILASTRPDKDGYDVSLRQVINKALGNLEGKFENKPRVEGALRRTLGVSYRWLGEDHTAEEQLRLSIAAFDRTEPFAELESLESKAQLAMMLRALGRTADVDESAKLCSDVLQRRRQLLGPQHEKTIVMMEEYAAILMRQDRFDESFEVITETLDLIDQTPDLATYDKTTLQLRLGDLYKRRDQLSKAIEVYQEIRSSPETPDVQRLHALTHLGEALDWKNRHDEAIAVLREAFQGRDDYLGPLHRDTLSTMRKLTRTLDESKRYEENLVLLDDSLKRHLKRDGPLSMSIFQARTMRARALIATKQDAAAKAFMDETVRRYNSGLGRNHEYTIKATKQLTAYLSQMSKVEKQDD